jgi:hypothetical protein
LLLIGLLAFVLCSLSPELAVADNPYWVMGKQDADYAGITGRTYTYDWAVPGLPSAMHVSSFYMYLDGDTYLEAGVRKRGFDILRDLTKPYCFYVYENYPQTTQQVDAWYTWCTPGNWYVVKIENSQLLAPGASKWDVWVAGNQVANDKNMYSMWVANPQTVAERGTMLDPNTAAFDTIRNKWPSDKAWHNWTSIRYVDNDYAYKPLQVSGQAWVSVAGY